jgi:hypothetical protein
MKDLVCVGYWPPWPVVEGARRGAIAGAPGEVGAIAVGGACPLLATSVLRPNPKINPMISTTTDAATTHPQLPPAPRASGKVR